MIILKWSDPSEEVNAYLNELTTFLCSFLLMISKALDIEPGICFWEDAYRAEVSQTSLE